MRPESPVRKLASQVRLVSRYARGLAAFVAEPLSLEDCRSLIETQLQQRVDSFLAVVRRGVFERSDSPYLPLFQGAGIDFDALERLAHSVGVEGSLQRLHDAGVHVTLDEFKGHTPIVRPGLTLEVSDADFDNPLRTGHFEGRTGGSGGRPRRLLIDLDVLAQDTASYGVCLDAWGATERPMAVWRPVPPANAGIKKLIMRGKLGGSVERWFTQMPGGWRPGSFRYSAFTALTRRAFNARGRRFPVAEFVPVRDAARVARWLAALAGDGVPAHLDTPVSSAVRVCMAAKTEDLDISGTFFRVGSEPLTEAKARVIADAGCVASVQYAMAEVGPIATACAAGGGTDDMHLLEDKVALVQSNEPGAGRGAGKPLFLTTVLDSCPKLMINVETGDRGVLETRDCGCPLGRVGYARHLHHLRSYEKLTSEGVNFLGTDLHELLENVLPARFGGHPTDYQFVEREEAGLTWVGLIVSERVGPLDEPELRQTVLDHLAARDVGHHLMSTIWSDGETLRVVRCEPQVTAAAKILPLHVERDG